TYVGYTCLFSEEFLSLSERSEGILQSPLFKLGGTPVLKINTEQRELLNGLFRKMIEEQQSDYQYKDDLIRNYIHLIIHEALKLQPEDRMDQKTSASERLISRPSTLYSRRGNAAPRRILPAPPSIPGWFHSTQPTPC
ncbi:MAG: hypothetical protein WA960_18360, partial [Tunicatimonas sp.]